MLFRSFGCGEKGDAIDFVAKYYNRSPREAAMQIADEFGIIYDSSVRSPPKPVSYTHLDVYKRQVQEKDSARVKGEAP